MKKFLLLAMTLLMALSLVAGCGSDSPKKMVIGLDDNFAPMGFRNEKNEIVGYDIDLAKEACKRAGMEVEFKPIDWASKEAETRVSVSCDLELLYSQPGASGSLYALQALYGKCSAGSCS